LLGNKAIVYGIDPDEASIFEARENAASFGLLPESCFHFEHTPIQTFSQRDDVPKFDLIVSNPPFFNKDLKPSREDRLKSRHRDGQLPFEELVESVVKLLAPCGRFAVILPPVESDEFRAVAEGRLYCHKTTSVRPTANKPVYRHVREYGLNPTEETMMPLLDIRDADNEYTPEYLELMRDYLFVGANRIRPCRGE